MDKQQLLESLKSEGFPNEIVTAFAKVKREDFIPEQYQYLAYEDMALPLENGATISQPYTIAFMLNLLELQPNKNQKILEIGSGSGYVLALISAIIKKGKIYGIEIIPSLANKSKKLLKKDKKIKILNKDGSNGLPDKAPFDRILISASANEIPTNLYPQLKNNGILVAPVRDSIFQIRKKNKKIEIKEFPGLVFVPLVRNN